MFNWLKRFHKAASLATTSMVATTHWEASFVKVAGQSGARYYDITFWEAVADCFRAKWREVDPASKEPAGLLEQRLGVYLSFLGDTVLKEAQSGLITPAELEQVGVFIARASVLDLPYAVLSDPVRTSPIFDLLPRAWLETAGVTPEQFEYCYFQRTGKHRAHQRLEEVAGGEMADKLLGHMSKLNEQERGHFVRDFEEHMEKSVRKEFGGPHNAPPSQYYVTVACQHCNGSIEFDANQLPPSETRAVECPHCQMETMIFKPEPTVPPIIPPRNDFEGANFYLQSAEQGDADAQCRLGFCYYNGESVPQNYAEAMKWFLKAAEQDHVAAQSEVGMCYYTGRGVRQDDKKAIKWFLIAAERGNASAQRTLGICYTFGQGVSKNYFEASKWIRKAAEQGLANAQSLLGICYSNGRGVPQNFSEANEWLRKAAEQGEITAQTTLAAHYEFGHGVAKNHGEAANWFRKAAERGYAPAQFGLGVAYCNGLGVPQDYIEAVKWLSEAAKQGFAAAQFKLADCIFMERGMPTNIEEGYKWLSLAATQGDSEAVAMSAYISKSMTSAQIADGRRRAAAFVPKKNIFEEKRHC